MEREMPTFVLERVIMEVILPQSAKNISSGASYSYNDDVSNIKNAEVIFYRLKMVDKDGTFEYSNVVSIRMPLKNNIIVKGNPFTDRIKIQITSSQKENIQMRLYNAIGQTVASNLQSGHQ
jgi:hypothetical protein